jgi:hypothetical protein
MIAPESKHETGVWTDGGGPQKRLSNVNMRPAGTPRISPNNRVVQASDSGSPELELALLRRGVGRRDAGQERCRECHRTPLVGETVYVCGHDGLLCELCRALEQDPPRESRVVHGQEFGHTMKLTDHRAA